MGERVREATPLVTNVAGFALGSPMASITGLVAPAPLQLKTDHSCSQTLSTTQPYRGWHGYASCDAGDVRMDF